MVIMLGDYHRGLPSRYLAPDLRQYRISMVLASHHHQLTSIVVKNSGVDETVVENTFAQSKTFFQQSPAVKKDVSDNNILYLTLTNQPPVAD